MKLKLGVFTHRKAAELGKRECKLHPDAHHVLLPGLSLVRDGAVAVVLG